MLWTAPLLLRAPFLNTCPRILHTARQLRLAGVERLHVGERDVVLWCRGALAARWSRVTTAAAFPPSAPTRRGCSARRRIRCRPRRRCRSHRSSRWETPLFRASSPCEPPLFPSFCAPLPTCMEVSGVLVDPASSLVQVNLLFRHSGPPELA